MTSDVNISVVIPIRNEGRFIRQTLEQLLQQELGDIKVEFLVVDGMSSDKTKEIVESVQAENPERAIRLLENGKRLSSAARNIGIREAVGEYVLIVDGHVYIPNRNMLRRCVELARQYDAKILGRPQRLIPPGRTHFQSLVAAVRASRVGHSPESHIFAESTGFVSPMSVGVMYDRTLVLDLGGFDETFDAAEDLEFNYRLERLGEKCLISPELEVYYYPRESLVGLFKQMRRYGLGRAKFLTKYPERATLDVYVPAAVVTASVCLGVMSIWSNYVLATFIALVVTYLALVLVTNRISARQFGLRGLMVVPIAITIHIGLGVGFIGGLIAARFLKNRSALSKLGIRES